MDYTFLNACVVGTMTANIVNPSRRSFLEVISGTEGVLISPSSNVFSAALARYRSKKPKPKQITFYNSL